MPFRAILKAPTLVGDSYFAFLLFSKLFSEKEFRRLRAEECVEKQSTAIPVSRFAKKMLSAFVCSGGGEEHIVSARPHVLFPAPEKGFAVPPAAAFFPDEK